MDALHFRHNVLSYSCLVFCPTVLATTAIPRLNYAWLAVMLTSVYHHHRPHNTALVLADQLAVFNLVYQNAVFVVACPVWLLTFYALTVAYTTMWYYPTRLGYVPTSLHLPLHLTTYAATSICGCLIASYAPAPAPAPAP